MLIMFSAKSRNHAHDIQPKPFSAFALAEGLATHAGVVCGLAVVVAVNFWEEITDHPGINFLWAMPLGLVVQIIVGVLISWCFP